MRFRFAALTYEDLPLLHRWLAEPHVARWWGEPEDWGPSIEGIDPTHAYIVHLNGDPIGLIQTYRWADYSKEAAAVGAGPEDAGIDYLIGDSSLIGQGIGPEMLRAFIDEVIGSGVPLQVNVAVANRRSWRCLERLGFTRDPAPRMIEGEPGPQYILSYGPSIAP